MNRRSFLKGLFVASVTPASCVRALYRPAITCEWARFKGKITWDYSDLFKPGIIKTRRVVTDMDGNVYKDGLRINSEKGKGFPERWKNYNYGHTGITGEMIEELRAAFKATTFQPPKRSK